MKSQTYPSAEGLDEEDLFVVSYPRSGNTLVRTLLARMMFSEDRLEGLRDLDVLVPDIYVGLPKGNRSLKPRFIKTHQPYAWRHEGQRAELYRRVIYVARYPLDAIQSYHHFLGKRHPTFDVSLDDFAREVVNGSRFPGSWNEHVLSWCGSRSDSVLVITYESIMDDFAGAVGKLAAWLGRDIKDFDTNRLAQLCSISEMRRLDEKKPLISSSQEFIRDSGERRNFETDIGADVKDLIYARSMPAMELLGYAENSPGRGPR